MSMPASVSSQMRHQIPSLLRDYGVKPFVLQQWKIHVENDPMEFAKLVFFSWHKYRMTYKVDDTSHEAMLVSLMEMIKEAAQQLRVLNPAKSIEHMEAIALMAFRPQRPTIDDIHREQL